jgi:hypothetical protein
MFRQYKEIHISLDKEVHTTMRMKLFEHNLSLQEVFREFSEQLVQDDRWTTKILERLIMRKIKESIEGKPKRQVDRRIGELDHDAVYDLIGEGQIIDEAL